MRRVVEMLPVLPSARPPEPYCGRVVRVELDVEHADVIAATIVPDDVQPQSADRVYLRRVRDLETAARRYSWTRSILGIERHGAISFPDARSWVTEAERALSERERLLSARAA